jgi:hypothetical protein
VNLTDRDGSNPSTTVHEIQSWPRLITQGVPVAMIVVEELREGEALFPHMRSDRIAVMLEGKLGAMNTDDGKPTPAITLHGIPDPGNGVETVDSAECPDVEEDHPAAQLAHTDRVSDPATGFKTWELRCGRRLGTAGRLPGQRQNGQ